MAAMKKSFMKSRSP